MPAAAEAARLSRIIELQRALGTAGLERQQAVEDALEAAQALTGADGSGVVLHGLGTPLRGSRVQGHSSTELPLSNVIWTLLDECARTDSVRRSDDAVAVRQALLCVPVQEGGTVIGAIGVLTHRASAFSESDERYLQLVAGMLSAALTRAGVAEADRPLRDEQATTLEALRESEERYRTVTEQIREVLFETDPDGRVSFLSGAWQEVTGFPVERSLGADLLGLVCEEDRAATLGALRPLVRGERTQCSQSARYRTLDGGVRWLELRARLRIDSLGRILGTAGTLNDITERVDADHALRRQALTFATIHDAVVVTGPDGLVLDWNPAAERIFGYSRDEIIGQSPNMLAADPEAALEVSAARARAERWAGEMRARRSDGAERTCEVVLEPLIDAAGVLDGAVIVCRDVTDRKRLERQLLQAQKLEAIGQLAAGIAHEINTPTQYVADNVRFASQALVEVISVVASHRRVREKLRAMMPDAEAVLEADAVERNADIEFIEAELPLALEQSLEGIERIAEIVRGMKAFSQPGTGSPAPADLNEQLESALAVARNEWRYAAEIVRDLDPSLPLVYCRAGEISQVFLSVILNAAHAIAELHGSSERGMGEIRVGTRRDGDFVETRIGDTGGGIPEEARARIFDPFFTTRTVGSGTGQGLAIAHAVIEKHGGTISFETEVGVGTTFIIRLPLLGVHAMAAVGASA